MEAISRLKAELPVESYALNFQPIQIRVDLGRGRSRQDRAYRVTRDGFTPLAMGFTDKRAMMLHACGPSCAASALRVSLEAGWLCP